MWAIRLGTGLVESETDILGRENLKQRLIIEEREGCDMLAVLADIFQSSIVFCMIDNSGHVEF